MKTRDFLGKLGSRSLWGNLLAMALVVVALALGVKYGLALYTHHGEGIKVPNLSKMTSHDARLLLESDGLVMMVSDSGYNKKLPADCILAQTPGAGTQVKRGHIIYVSVNAPSSPSFAIPDIVDNSSYREAEARLSALGFRLLPPKYVEGEKDWVYGILSRGRRVGTGDMVSIGTPLTLLVGNGRYGDDEDISYMESETPVYGLSDAEDEADVDDFEEMPQGGFDHE